MHNKINILDHKMVRVEKEDDEKSYSWMDKVTSIIYNFYIMEKNKKAMEFFESLQDETGGCLEFVRDFTDTMPDVLINCPKYRNLTSILYEYAVKHKIKYDYRRSTLFIRIADPKKLIDKIGNPYTDKLLGNFQLNGRNLYKLLPYFFKGSELARVNYDERVRDLDKIHAPTALWVLDAIEKFDCKSLNSKVLSEFKKIQRLNTLNYEFSKL